MFRLVPLMIAVLMSLSCKTGCPQESESTKDSVRTKSHQFLFEKFVNSKKCTWSDDKSALKEVVVFEGDLSFEDVVEIELMQNSNKIARFFDRVIIKGKDLTELESVGFVDKDCVRFMSVASKLKSEECTLNTALTSRAFIQGKVANVECGCRSAASISQIVFHSTKGIPKEYGSFKAQRGRYSEKATDLQSSFLEEVKKMSFAELSESLSGNSESVVRIVLMPRLGPGGDNFNIRGVLADRRVAKMHEHLSQLPREVASELSLASYESEFVSFQDFYEDANIAPTRILHAMEANLFLCSEFCSPDTVVEAVENWKDWYDKELIRKKGDLQFSVFAKPDPLLVANLYTNLIIKKNGFSTAQGNIWLHETFSDLVQHKSRVPQLNDRWFMASDWTPNQLEVIKAVPTYDSHTFIRREESQELVLNILKAELLSTP